MFNIEEAINAWRKGLRAQGIKSREILDELESHLREDVQQQIESGRHAGEAFRAAVQRIGQGPALKAEFAKVRGGKQNRLHLLFRVACFVSAPFMLVSSAWALLDSEGPGIGGWLTFFAIACMALYLGSLPFWYRFLPNPYRRGFGIAFKALIYFVAAFPIFALLEAAEVIHVPVETALFMFAWALTAAVTGTVLAYMCLDIERGLGWGILDFPSTDKFTDVAQQAIEIAYEEAARLGHDFVGTEHLLLGIISSESGLLMDLFRKWDLNSDKVRAEIEKMVGRGVGRKSARDIPFTPRSKRALALALKEAHGMGHSFIHSEHIFLGLLLESEGVAGLVLRQLGVNAQDARRDILQGMGPDGGDGMQPVVA
jgi:hypothetical protein